MPHRAAPDSPACRLVTLLPPAAFQPLDGAGVAHMLPAPTSLASLIIVLLVALVLVLVLIVFLVVALALALMLVAVLLQLQEQQQASQEAAP